MKKTQAIIAIAGLGRRLQAEASKPLVQLNARPMMMYTLWAFEQAKRVESYVLVVQQEHVTIFEELCQQYDFKKVRAVVVGGEKRCDSIANGLAHCEADTEIVVVHDGARPLIMPDIIDQAVRQCGTKKAVVVGVPVASTIKELDVPTLTVHRTLSRDVLWAIQTPQVFDKDLLVRAHRQAEAQIVTDDAMLVEQLGQKVHVMMGDYKNIKITTKDDIMVAETFLAHQDVQWPEPKNEEGN